MVSIFPEDIDNGVVIVVLAVGQIDGNRIKILLEQSLKLSLCVLLLQLINLRRGLDYKENEENDACEYLAIASEDEDTTPFADNLGNVLKFVFPRRR